MSLFRRYRTIKTNGDISMGIYEDKVVLILPMNEGEIKYIRNAVEGRKVKLRVIKFDFLGDG